MNINLNSTIPMKTLFTRTIAILTVVCFTFSFVISQPMHAAVERIQSRKKLDVVFSELVLPASIGRITDAYSSFVDNRSLFEKQRAASYELRQPKADPRLPARRQARRLGRTAPRAETTNHDLRITNHEQREKRHTTYDIRNTVFINIQDLHCHPEAQRNIAQILSLLDEQCNLTNIYVEGSSGPVDVTWLTSITDRELKKHLIESLVAQGKLTGAEYYAATALKQQALLGVEDKAIHHQNLVRLSKMLKASSARKQIFRGIQNRINILKNEYYSRPQKSLDSLVLKHKNGALSSKKYYAKLKKYAQKVNINTNSYININKFCKLQELEKKVNYKRVSLQLQAFMAMLKHKLPYSAYSALAQQTDKFADSHKFFVYLMRIADAYNPDISEKFPHLDRFFGFLRSNQDINPMELLNEEKLLVREILYAHVRDKAQRNVVFLVDYVSLMHDFITAHTSAKDYAYCVHNFKDFKDIWVRYVGSRWIDSIEQWYNDCSEYYEVNLKRNKVFLNTISRHLGSALASEAESNLDLRALSPFDDHVTPVLKQLAKAEDVIVLISGGFHTDGITQLLKKSRTSYMVITPNITQDSAFAERVYCKRVSQQANVLIAQNSLSRMSSSGLTRRSMNATIPDPPVKPWDDKDSVNFPDIARQQMGLIYLSDYHPGDRIPEILGSMIKPLITGKLNHEQVRQWLKNEGRKRSGKDLDIVIEPESDTAYLFTLIENINGAVTRKQYSVDKEFGTVTCLSESSNTPETQQPRLSKGVITLAGFDRFVRLAYKKLFNKTLTTLEYENEVAPKIEEVLFTAVPLVASLVLGALFAWDPVVVLHTARIVHIALHLFGRKMPTPGLGTLKLNPDETEKPLAWHEKIAIPAIISGLILGTYHLTLLLLSFSGIEDTIYTELIAAIPAIFASYKIHSFFNLVTPLINTLIGTRLEKATISGQKEDSSVIEEALRAYITAKKREILTGDYTGDYKCITAKNPNELKDIHAKLDNLADREVKRAAKDNMEVYFASKSGGKFAWYCYFSKQDNAYRESFFENSRWFRKNIITMSNGIVNIISRPESEFDIKGTAENRVYFIQYIFNLRHQIFIKKHNPSAFIVPVNKIKSLDTIVFLINNGYLPSNEQARQKVMLNYVIPMQNGHLKFKTVRKKAIRKTFGPIKNFLSTCGDFVFDLTLAEPAAPKETPGVSAGASGRLPFANLSHVDKKGSAEKESKTRMQKTSKPRADRQAAARSRGELTDLIYKHLTEPRAPSDQYMLLEAAEIVDKMFASSERIHGDGLKLLPRKQIEKQEVIRRAVDELFSTVFLFQGEVSCLGFTTRNLKVGIAKGNLIPIDENSLAPATLRKTRNGKYELIITEGLIKVLLMCPSKERSHLYYCLIKHELNERIYRTITKPGSSYRDFHAFARVDDYLRDDFNTLFSFIDETIVKFVISHQLHNFISCIPPPLRSGKHPVFNVLMETVVRVKSLKHKAVEMYFYRDMIHDLTNMSAPKRKHIKRKAEDIDIIVHAPWEADIRANSDYLQDASPHDDPVNFNNCLEFAEDIGAKLIDIHAGNPAPDKNTLGSMVSFIKRSAEKGIKVSIENSQYNTGEYKDKTKFLKNLKYHTAEEFIRLYERISAELYPWEREYFGVTLDVAHARLAGSAVEFYESIKEAGLPVFNVHLNQTRGEVDEHLPIYKSGAVPIVLLLQMLKQDNYTGYVTQEPRKDMVSPAITPIVKPLASESAGGASQIRMKTVIRIIRQATDLAHATLQAAAGARVSKHAADLSRQQPQHIKQIPPEMKGKTVYYIKESMSEQDIEFLKHLAEMGINAVGITPYKSPIIPIDANHIIPGVYAQKFQTTAPARGMKSSAVILNIYTQNVKIFFQRRAEEVIDRIKDDSTLRRNLGLLGVPFADTMNPDIVISCDSYGLLVLEAMEEKKDKYSAVTRIYSVSPDQTVLDEKAVGNADTVWISTGDRDDAESFKNTILEKAPWQKDRIYTGNLTYNSELFIKAVAPSIIAKEIKAFTAAGPVVGEIAPPHALGSIKKLRQYFTASVGIKALELLPLMEPRRNLKTSRHYRPLETKYSALIDPALVTHKDLDWNKFLNSHKNKTPEMWLEILSRRDYFGEFADLILKEATAWALHESKKSGTNMINVLTKCIYQQIKGREQLRNFINWVHKKGGRITYWINIDKNNPDMLTAVKYWAQYGFDELKLVVNDVHDIEYIRQLADIVSTASRKTKVVIRPPKGSSPAALALLQRALPDLAVVRYVDELIHDGKILRIHRNERVEVSPDYLETLYTKSGKSEDVFTGLLKELARAGALYLSVLFGTRMGADIMAPSKDNGLTLFANCRCLLDNVNKRKFSPDVIKEKLVQIAHLFKSDTSESAYNAGLNMDIDVLTQEERRAIYKVRVIELQGRESITVPGLSGLTSKHEDAKAIPTQELFRTSLKIIQECDGLKWDIARYFIIDFQKKWMLADYSHDSEKQALCRACFERFIEGLMDGIVQDDLERGLSQALRTANQNVIKEILSAG